MAETVKILSPEKTVILANPSAGCPMAEQMDKELIRYAFEEIPSKSKNTLQASGTAGKYYYNRRRSGTNLFRRTAESNH